MIITCIAKNVVPPVPKRSIRAAQPMLKGGGRIDVVSSAHPMQRIDRTLNQLERLQQMGKGQPVPQTRNVNLAT